MKSPLSNRSREVLHARPRVSRPAAAIAPLIEGLEDRRLMSVSLSGGVLTVTGTAAADQIEVKRTAPGSTNIKVEVKTGTAKTERVFSLAAINQIVLRG